VPDAMRRAGAPARILVKAVNWLGDVVMTVPALRALRHGFPAAHLAVLIKRELASFFDGADWIDEVLPYRIGSGAAGIGDRLRLIGELHAHRFDLAVVLPRSFESALWIAAARIPRRVGFVAQGRGPLLTDRIRRAPEMLARHQENDYLDLLRLGLGISGSPDETHIEVAARHRDAMLTWLSERRRGAGALVALAAAAAYGPAKEWPAPHFARLIDLLAERYAVECVLVGAPSERMRCEQIAAASRSGALIAAGETSIGEALALLSLCDGFAGNDSGSMHASGALGIPTVGIFGSTDPQRTSPLGPKTAVLYDHIECSPCLARTCRFGHYDCLRRIEPERVAKELERLGAF
jgi:lipopolysaccharide heptosyltransferase II